jgi:hypothetical protein
MNPIRAAALSALCAMLLACAPHSPPPHAAPAPSGSPAEPVEGTYRGTSTRFQADRKGCPHPGLVSFIVWDGKFQYRWDHATYIDVVIKDDDTLEGQTPDFTLRGKRDATRIEGDVTNGLCGLHFTVIKSLN